MGLWLCLFVCGSVTTITRNCMHRSSPNWIFWVKVVTISSWLNFGRPAPPGKRSAAGRNFLALPYYSQSTVFASLPAFFFRFFCCFRYVIQHIAVNIHEICSFVHLDLLFIYSPLNFFQNMHIQFMCTIWRHDKTPKVQKLVSWPDHAPLTPVRKSNIGTAAGDILTDNVWNAVNNSRSVA